MIDITTVIAIFTALVAIQLLARVHVIHETERGLLYRSGRFVRILEPGSHCVLHLPQFTGYGPVQIERVDVREHALSVTGQEVTTHDRAPIKVSVSVTYSLRDPRKALEATASYSDELYVATQLALRTVIAPRGLDEMLESRDAADRELTQRVREAAWRLGIEVERAVFKDVTVSGDIKRAMADVVKARSEGQARLERARAETAALRGLANAASLLERQPALYQLRLLQAAQSAAENTGNTLIFGAGDEEQNRSRPRNA